MVDWGMTDEWEGPDSVPSMAVFDIVDLVFCMLPLFMAVVMCFIVSFLALVLGVPDLFIPLFLFAFFLFWILRGVYSAAVAPRNRALPRGLRISICVRLVLLIVICVLISAGFLYYEGGARAVWVSIGVSFPSMIAVRHLLLLYLSLQKERLNGG